MARVLQRYATMTFKKLLCATDFSPGAQKAMQVAIRLANEEDAELVIVHAWDAPTGFGAELPVPTDVAQQLSDDAVGGLEAAVHDARAAGAKRVTSQLFAGTPWSTLVDVLDDPSFDLVVMGTHGRTALSRIVLGSVAEKVVRHSPCSVLVVRPDAQPAPFKHVLCPIDFSEYSQQALKLAGELSRRNAAALTLLSVVEINFYTGRRPAHYIHYLDRTARELLHKSAAELETTLSTPVTTRCSIGSPGGQILALLDDDRSIDLVVMGSHGRTGIARAFIGSVAEKVVRHAGCPVLVTRKRS